MNNPSLPPPPQASGIPPGPQTPGIRPPPGMLSPAQPGDPVHDLPHDLLEAGWRRFWSRREGRPYFFNKVSNESRWEIPGQDAFTDSDPLGIDASPAPMPSRSLSIDTAMPSTSNGVGMKRRSSEDPNLMSPAKKISFSYSPYWNFDIPTNVMIWERKPCYLPPPHPEIELLRTQLMSKLRIQYKDLCRNREKIEPPRESFNRWLLERKVIDKGHDPVLPCLCTPEVSPSMYREIMHDIPMKVVKCKYFNETKRQLSKYAQAAKELMDSRSASAESRKLVKWQVEDVIQWLQRTENASYADYDSRLVHLKKQCQPHIMEVAKSSVEGICLKMYNTAVDHVKKIHERHWEILAEMKIYPSTTGPPPPRRNIPCYPIQMVIPAPRMSGIEHHIEGDVVSLRFKSEHLIKVNTSHFHKLEQLYRCNCRDDPKFENFLPRVWCLLRRYHTYFGLSADEGSGLQGALPVPVFECLHRVFNVTFECFASPLNCYFKQYCSAFVDTDGYFGSRGPLLDFSPTSGSFEANPPFGEELMEAMVDHFESLLSESNDPLSFIVFVPDWRDPPTEALMRLESSRFKRKQATVVAYEHEYRQGFQHIVNKADTNIRASHGTVIIFLQNEAGFNKWGPTRERLNELLLAYNPQIKDATAPSSAT
ncbi:hypothetical protein CAPTEDRAFT_219923 [Capitella teleta]|uniref:WW domain-containing protein n=1 Tax=Capitella teleta TaxID=283909 RepID=R7U274_CAPTE|nr:hypothetical protein CAPTEDRAFT_219923 [Capitella teleta]|eukprot:ELU00100.1 hypothetical protein CAPTEDRAFT_219923 [Capitella teleta]